MLRLLVASLACTAWAATNTCAAPGAIPLILDCDPNIDDVLALAYLAKVGLYDLKAVIVTSTGFSNPSAGVAIIYRELEMLGLGHVDVAVGPFYPKGCSIFSDGNLDANKACALMRVVNREDHFKVDNMYGALDNKLPHSTRHTEYENGNGMSSLPLAAAEVYKKHIDAGCVTVMTTGPYTSLASFQDKYPESFAKIETLHSMGGAVDAGGNVYTIGGNDVSEFNFMADTTAAKEIITSAIPNKFLTSLDGTNFVSMTHELFDAFAAIPNPEAEFLTDLTTHARDNWFSGVSGFFGELADGTSTPATIADGYYLWDPLCAVLSVMPQLAVWQTSTLSVTTSVPVDMNNDGNLVRDPTGGQVKWTVSLTPENAEAARTAISDVLKKDCISGQPLSLTVMADAFARISADFGTVVGSVFVPHVCDGSAQETLGSAAATAYTCPVGYHCDMGNRRKLRFGHANARECVKH